MQKKIVFTGGQEDLVKFLKRYKQKKKFISQKNNNLI